MGLSVPLNKSRGYCGGHSLAFGFVPRDHAEGFAVRYA